MLMEITKELEQLSLDTLDSSTVYKVSGNLQNLHALL